jgi:hypothetical protein
MVEWFRRFGDIPGISYVKPVQIDPSALEGYIAVPRQSVFDAGGKHYESLMWSYGDQLTSASPAHSRAFVAQRAMSSAELVNNCFEGLELPGEPRDYHFLIQGAADELWRRRRQEPDLIAEVERLLWLDLDLVGAKPDSFTYDQGEGARYVEILAFGMLVALFEREGALHEALKVAERAERYGQCERGRDELRERIGAVEREGRG